MPNTVIWYTAISKPWVPPSWLFGPVWTVLYAILFITLGIVLYKIHRKEYPKSLLLPFGLNLIFSFAFSPIQFTLQNNSLAALDIVLALITLSWLIKSLWLHSRTLALINFPYLAWVALVAILQLTETSSNF